MVSPVLSYVQVSVVSAAETGRHDWQVSSVSTSTVDKIKTKKVAYDTQFSVNIF